MFGKAVEGEVVKAKNGRGVGANGKHGGVKSVSLVPKSPKSQLVPDHSGKVSTISAGASLTGKIDLQCILHVDGRFEGEVRSTNLVEVGEDGYIKGNIKAQRLTVAGKFFGNAVCETIELLSGGEVEGKLTAYSLMVDSKSLFQGESILRKDTQADDGGARAREGKEK